MALHATLNLLAMAMTKPHFRLSSVFITCNCAFLMSSLFLGLAGGTSLSQASPGSIICMPNYDPFSLGYMLPLAYFAAQTEFSQSEKVCSG